MISKEEFSKLWDNDLCPIINGIIYADGTIKILNPKEAKKYYDIPEYCGIESIYSLSDKEYVGFTDIYKRKHVEIIDLNLRIYCGEGSWGSEGFVAVCDVIEGNELLRWIAYFDYSNPIERVEYNDGIIIAYNNHGHKWMFNISYPEKVEVDF
jgi:hypothetical protein